MNDVFAINRFWLLVRSDFLTNYRSLAITSAGLAVLIFVVSLIPEDPSHVFYNSWFGLLLFLYGIHLTGKAFKGLHDKTRNQSYLLVPASSVEKTLAELFRVTIGFIAYLLVFMTCVSFVTEGLNLIIYGDSYQSFKPFSPFVWEMVGSYIFLQSFFFLGAAWFSKHPLIKTVLAVSVISLGLMVVHWLSTQLFQVNYLEHITFTYIYDRKFFGGLDVLLPLCCWSIAWLRVREAQISEGV